MRMLKTPPFVSPKSGEKPYLEVFFSLYVSVCYVWRDFLNDNIQATISVFRLIKNMSIGLLQQTITWYKIRHTGGQAHYYSRTGTLKQRGGSQWG